eukprot:GEZU01021751.1.p1 GENE.GEZU01021751.1~~GEZU01021751.1.p1  ORF type:complete len:760 (-),score=302.30 GEZU01021751.1:241-2520(-)
MFDGHEEELRDLSNNIDQMYMSLNSSKELMHVLNQDQLFSNNDNTSSASSTSPASSEIELMTANQMANSRQGGLGQIAGVLPTDKKGAFNLLVYRVTRGNVIPNITDIEEPFLDPVTNTRVQKSVFVIFYTADKARDKIRKVCDALGARIHEIPNEGGIEQEKAKIKQGIQELEGTIASANARRQKLLAQLQNGLLRWKEKVAREKYIYHTMNMFDYRTSQHSVIAQAWVPARYLDRVRAALKEAEVSSNAQVESYMERIETKETHPTYFVTNKFTGAFQMMVESYGIARYKELNPSVLTIITFPFLFAVMFGDAGHGIILFAFSLLLCIFERRFEGKQLNEIFAMLFSGRYILLLMSIFSIFTGFMYNDWFSLMTNFFVSHWDFDQALPEPEKNPHWTYPIGVDPGWVHTNNKLNYMNSLKMKLSVIMGVIQMMVGLFLSLGNHIYFRNWIDVFFEFLPEVVILGFTFGYMCVLIIVKWCIQTPEVSPNLLQTMTSFFLQPGSMDQVPLFDGQLKLQQALLIIAIIMIPVLLFPKPIAESIIHKKKHNKKHGGADKANGKKNDGGEHASPATAATVVDVASPAAAAATSASASASPSAHHPSDSDDESAKSDYPLHGNGEEEEEPFIFSEALIKQVIHTIEFILGCVSNTASYLRLWALSLAHAQLSEVFYNMTLLLVMDMDPQQYKGLDYSGVGFVVAFAVWFVVTVAVLLVMETLSAFLHALRLHWVEFQSKFYVGDGKQFVPFSLKNVLKPVDSD